MAAEHGGGVPLLLGPFSDERIIVKLDLRKITDEGSATGESLADNILFRRASADSFSDLYCPMLYREYVVGYIHLSNHRDRREKIGEDLVEYTYEFARVLCHALQLNGYLKAEGQEDDLIESSVIDMSASGLLFTYSGPKVVEELQAGSDIDLVLQTETRELVVGSKVMRRFAADDNYFFGVEFVRVTRTISGTCSNISTASSSRPSSPRWSKVGCSRRRSFRRSSWRARHAPHYAYAPSASSSSRWCISSGETCCSSDNGRSSSAASDRICSARVACTSARLATDASPVAMRRASAEVAWRFWLRKLAYSSVSEASWDRCSERVVT